MIQAVRMVVHDDAPPEEAFEYYQTLVADTSDG